MSYDLYLLRVAPGQDAGAVLEGHLGAQERELNPGPASAGKEAEKLRLTKALVRFDPGLTPVLFDFASLAALEQSGEAEMRRKYRHVELNGDDYSGIQITLWDDAAEVTFPYWHSGEQAERVLLRVWDYLEVLAQWSGFTVYDPQLGTVLDLRSGFDAALAHYLSGGTALKRTQPKRPRWPI